MVTAKKSSSKTSLTVTRQDVEGKKQDLTLKVGPNERKFIVENARKITYDPVREIFTFKDGKHKTTLQRKLYSTLVKAPGGRVRRAAKNDYRVETFKV